MLSPVLDMQGRELIFIILGTRGPHSFLSPWLVATGIKSDSGCLGVFHVVRWGYEDCVVVWGQVPRSGLHCLDFARWGSMTCSAYVPRGGAARDGGVSLEEGTF